MAIQNRRGVYGDFRPEKMVSGELAVVLSGDPGASSGRSVYICFEPGHVKRITTYEDFENELQAATQEIQEAFTDDVQNAISAAVTATAAANAAIEAANAATEAANAAAEAAGAYVLGDISGKTISFTEAAERENIGSGESASTLIGKIKKWLSDLKSVAFSGAYHDLSGTPDLKDAAFATIADNLTTAAAGSVLDARQGKALNDRLTELNGDIATLDDKNQWNLIGSVTGSTTISANLTSYREIMCVAKSGVSTLIYTAYFPAQILTGEESTITMTGICFKTTYGLSQKAGTVKADKYGIRLGYLYETTVTETPSNTVDRAAFAVYAR